jgi:hypothetical protein
MYAGLIHEITTTGFPSEETCYEYAAGALTAFNSVGHKILEADCHLIDKGA